MGMIDRLRKQKDDVNYWRSMVDVILGLLLIVLLAMSLLMLGLMDRPLLEETGEYYEAAPAPDNPYPPGWPEPPAPEQDQTPIINNSGGGGGEDNPVIPPQITTLQPEPDDENRSAVLVRIRDRETDRILPIKGIEFEVLDETNHLLAYDVYYPERIEYTRFETTKKGDFYLPDKLRPGNYTLHNLNAPVDYDVMKDVEFSVTRGRDWDEPVLVDAYLTPCTNSILLETRDAETGQPVAGGLYTVMAPADVITTDGSIRYPAGEIVDTLSCDKTGTARTVDLYLGTFGIVQTEIPFGYARADMGRTVTIQKRPSECTVSVSMEKTTVLLSVRDELTLARAAGIPFVLTGSNARTVDLVADGNGEIHLTNLEKNADYSFSMKEPDNGYRRSDTVYSFHVDGDGLIDGNVLYTVTADARKIRCTFDASSAIFSRAIPGHDMGLFRADDGSVVEQWYSKEEPQLIEGLEPGTYVLTIDRREMKVNVKDTAAQQAFHFRVWLAEDIAAVALSVILLIGLLAAVWFVWRKKKKHAPAGERKSRK